MRVSELSKIIQDKFMKIGLLIVNQANHHFPLIYQSQEFYRVFW